MSGHHHHHRARHQQPSELGAGLIIRPLPRLRSRRAFLGDLGGGALALAVLTPVAIAACSDGGSGDGSDDATPPTAGSGETTASTAAAGESGRGDQSAAPDSSDAATGETSDLRWTRVNLGFVSAYVVARGNRAAVIDTGTAGSAETIGQSLTDLGLNYDDVESVILTHNHGDHIGSIADVLSMAVNATAYAGKADLGGIDGDITGLVGGEDIFGMEMVATPGHTPGSMSAIDHGTGLLIAGDALTIDGGQAAEPPAEFTADAEGARDSIRALAALTFNTLLVGHGDPIENSADESVAALVASF